MMTDQQLVVLVGNALVNNWEYFVTGILAIIGAGVAGAWWLSKQLHGKEVELLNLQLAHQSERFHQFETLVEQRISIIKQEAEVLRRKVLESRVENVSISAIDPVDSPTKDFEDLDVPAFLRRSVDDDSHVNEPKLKYETTNKLENFILKTDVIDNILKTAIALV